MHHRDAMAALLLYGVRMTSRRQRRNAAAQPRRDRAKLPARAAREFKLAESVSTLAYTREQAAEALGISLATLDRRVVPAIATVSTEWGGRLIPVAELERYLAERTQPPRTTITASRRPGRKLAVPQELAARIKAEHASGTSLGEIARRLNAERVVTAQGGRQWWPSTVRTVLARTDALMSSQATVRPSTQ